jgi:hypothetical protein
MQYTDDDICSECQHKMTYGANHMGNNEVCTLLPCFSVFYIIFYSFPMKET